MPTPAWRLLHILALCTLAITQPLLGILGDSPTFFTAHGSGPAQILWFTLTVSLVPAVVLGAVEVLVHIFRPQLDGWIHHTVVSLLVFLLAIQVVDALPGPWLVATVIALAVTVGLVALYTTNKSTRSALSLLAATPVIFVGIFLFVSPVSSIVFPAEVDAVEFGSLVSATTFARPEPPTVAESGPSEPSLAQRINERFPPVFLLVFDELPVASLLDETGEIDRVRWPNFARLADTSHFFSNATTVGFTTERAIPAILTGRYETAAAPVYSLYPENLFTLLGDVYDISSSDPLVDLCPPSVCNGEVPQSMRELLTTDRDEAELPATSPPSSGRAVATAEVPLDGSEPDNGSSLRSLLDDAMVVFGHLATPEGLHIGLPSIGATWGDFGGDLGTGDGADADTSTTSTLPIDDPPSAPASAP